jgi:hypothetical protein
MMTLDERLKYAEQIVFPSISFLLMGKGKAYAGSGPANGGFSRQAMGRLTKFLVWYVYAGKHWNGISTALTEYPEDPHTDDPEETLANKIDDLITYLVILRSMLEEHSDQELATMTLRASFPLDPVKFKGKVDALNNIAAKEVLG